MTSLWIGTYANGHKRDPYSTTWVHGPYLQQATAPTGTYATTTRSR